jgi:hypothetical protein
VFECASVCACVCNKRLLGHAFSFENPINREASFAVDGKTSLLLVFSVKLENTSQIKDQSTEIGQQDLRKKSYSGFRHIFSHTHYCNKKDKRPRVSMTNQGMLIKKFPLLISSISKYTRCNLQHKLR